MTHHEKDFTDYLEEAILKIDGAIEQQYANLRKAKLIPQDTANLFNQVIVCEAHTNGLLEAKLILLKEITWHKK